MKLINYSMKFLKKINNMNKNITLYSNDSSYGGISFISDKIDANVLLV